MNRPTNWLLAALYGAVVAIVVAYGGSYLLTHLGLSVINFPEGQALRGPEVLKLAALNLYAVQHVTLVGSGKVIDPLGAGLVNAQITLPLTIWIILPAIGLMMGGYAAARLRARNRRDMTLPAVVGSILYALILLGASMLARAKVGSFLLPEIEGIGANPPPVVFKPAIVSTLICSTGLGLFFMYLGSLLAVREEARSRTPGRWWACAKAAIIVAIVFQLLITAGGIIVMRRHANSQPITMSTLQTAPTVTGIAYGMLYGGTLHAEVSSRLQDGGKPQTILDYSANLYRGTVSSADGKQKQRAMSSTLLIAGIAIAALIAFLSGWLAVRCGSTDGSIPTALRMIVVQTTYLAVTMSVCKLILMISNKSAAFSATSATIAGLSFSWTMIPALLAYFFVSLLGAYSAHKRFSASLTGFPHAW